MLGGGGTVGAAYHAGALSALEHDLGWDARRRQCRRTLDRELRVLERNGIPSVVIEPGTEVLEHMSIDFMSEAATTEIVRAAFLDSGAQITRAPLLQALSARRAAQRTE